MISPQGATATSKPQSSGASPSLTTKATSDKVTRKPAEVERSTPTKATIQLKKEAKLSATDRKEDAKMPDTSSSQSIEPSGQKEGVNDSPAGASPSKLQFAKQLEAQLAKASPARSVQRALPEVHVQHDDEEDKLNDPWSPRPVSPGLTHPTLTRPRVQSPRRPPSSEFRHRSAADDDEAQVASSMASTHHSSSSSSSGSSTDTRTQTAVEHALADTATDHSSHVSLQDPTTSELSSGKKMHIVGRGSHPSLDISVTPPTPRPKGQDTSFSSMSRPKTDATTQPQVSLADELKEAESKPAEVDESAEQVSSSVPPVIKSQAEKPEEGADSFEEQVPTRRRSAGLSHHRPVARQMEQARAEEATNSRRSESPGDVSSERADTPTAGSDDNVPFRSRKRSGAVLASDSSRRSSAEDPTASLGRPSSSPDSHLDQDDGEPRDRSSSAAFRRRGRVIKRRRDTNQQPDETDSSFKSKGSGTTAATDAQATTSLSDRERARQKAVARAKQRRQQQLEASAAHEPTVVPVTAYTDDGWEVIDKGNPSAGKDTASARQEEVSLSSGLIEIENLKQQK